MTYVDGYLLVIPKKNVKDYIKMAKEGKKLWLKYGALDYKECMGDHLDTEGILTFPKLVKLKPTETLWFSFVTFKSKSDRNKINAKVMADPAMSPDIWKDRKMPFEMNRMSMGGFKAIVEKK